MVLIILSIVLGSAVVVWLWKVPIQKTVKAMKKNGSSAVEAYSVLAIFIIVMAGTAYMIAQVV